MCVDVGRRSRGRGGVRARRAGRLRRDAYVAGAASQYYEVVGTEGECLRVGGHVGAGHLVAPVVLTLKVGRPPRQPDAGVVLPLRVRRNPVPLDELVDA